ncbi:MAG: substrate-binding domain-containing protein, partial [Croceitalea sp.]|nr:substrate-binding domain-containing protein [Croceitalea sp.]
MIIRKISFYILLAPLLFLSCQKTETVNKIKIGFSQCLSDHPWRDAMNHSMKIKASLYPEVQLTIYEAQNDIEQQINHIELMIQNDADVIIVSPLDPSVIASSVEKAYDKGIPVIVLDRKVNTGKYTAFVGADNLEVGRNAGRYIASSSKESVNVIELRGSDFSSPVNERSQGFRQIIDTLEKVTLLGNIKGIDSGIPKEKFRKLLDSLSNRKIDYVYAFNDEMALQAWEVARDINREREIKFIGVDGLAGGDGGIESVLRGILEATILYPTGGAEAIELAIKAVKGENVQKNNKLNTTVIDRFNADIMKNQFDKINDQQQDLENQIAAITFQEERFTAQNNLLKLLMVLFAIILSLTAYSVYSMVTIRKKKRELELTNEKVTIQKDQISNFAKQLEVSNEAKLNFFTGLSHEFKTPITLILSAIESIGENAKVKGIQILSEVELIYNNSN